MGALNVRLWLAVLLVALLPVAYATVRIYFLNSLPDTWNVSIAAQAAWLHLAYEVLHEALLLPLYFPFGAVVADQTQLRKRISTVCTFGLLAYAVLTLLVLIGAELLTATMAQQVALRTLTASYIRLEAVAILIGVFNDICLIVLVTLGRHRLVLALVVLRALATVLLDAFFVGQFAWSLDLAVIGVAMTNIAVGSAMLVPSFIILYRLGLIGSPWEMTNAPWVGLWFRVAARSGLESVVRNLAFALMILRLMNEVEEAGLFWITNGFIWGWLLLPVLTLGTLIRQDVATHMGQLGTRFRGYILATGFIILIWLVTIPGWAWFVATAMGSPEAERVADLTLLLLGFYVVFAFNHMIDSYFYGMGRTDLMLYQSLFVSIFYYGTAYGAYQTGIFNPDLRAIAMLFGGGIVMDALVTCWQFHRAGYFDRARQGFLSA